MLNHCGTKPLTTTRLELRPLTEDDYEMMYDNWASDPEVARYMRWAPHRSWAVTVEYLNEIVKHYAEADFYNWGITEKTTGILFGAIGLVRPELDVKWTIPTATYGEGWEPGYCLGRKWWGRGYATEALCAVRDYWFNEVGGKWLRCCHAVPNVASGAVMQKAGFLYDHDAAYHKADGTEVPCRVYYLLKPGLEK